MDSNCFNANFAWECWWWTEKRASLRVEHGMCGVRNPVSKALLQSECQWSFDLGERRKGVGACMMWPVAR